MPVQSRPIRIGTRGSPLALAQAEETRRLLAAAHGLADADVLVVPMVTSGDRIRDRALAAAGGKGLFTLEIEEALLRGELDIAVHSAKDMPTALPAGLVLTAFLEREDARDVLVSRGTGGIAALPPGARVGSASLRRQALLLRQRPDLQIALIRGNVETRLRRVRDGAFDATILALAGLKRLGLADGAGVVLDLDHIPPAVGQGAIALEAREDDGDTRRLLAAIDHAGTHAALLAERAFLAVLDGSCRTPIAGHARIDDGTLRFHGMILRPDGSETLEARRAGPVDEAVALGMAVGEELKSRAPSGFFTG